MAQFFNLSNDFIYILFYLSINLSYHRKIKNMKCMIQINKCIGNYNLAFIKLYANTLKN